MTTWPRETRPRSVRLGPAGSSVAGPPSRTASTLVVAAVIDPGPRPATLPSDVSDA